MGCVFDGDCLVFDVQRFSVHDGPGIRTVVFFKGCPLRCRWCQNPESLRRAPELALYGDRCRGCGRCAVACPNGAIRTDGTVAWDPAACQVCGRCAEVCPHEARRVVGRRVPAEQLLAQLARDRAYYDATSGGVTLSGGEPLLQAQGAAELLGRCRAAGLHTAVETCGAVPWETFEQVQPLVDLFYFDLKTADDARHRELTGAPLGQVLDNARRLAQTPGATVAFRMPVVPGYNDDAATVEGVAGLLRSLGQSAVRLLPYHASWESKLGRIRTGQRPLGLRGEQGEQALRQVCEAFGALGIEAIVEGREPDGAKATPPSAFSERVWRLRQAVQSAPPAVCAERALLVTEYFRRPSARPLVIQKAEALRHVLRNRSATIYPDELLVGCFCSKRVGGSIYPELHGVAVLEDLFAFPKRKVNPLQIERADQLALATRVLPFWITRFLSLKAFSLPKALRFVVEQLKGAEYLINETGGVSHFVPDYALLLREGTSGIAARAGELAAAAAQPEQRDFYRAVQVICCGLEEMATVYATLAGRLAAAEPDAGRRAELEQIAHVCGRVPRLPAETLHEALQSLLFAQIALNLESLDNAVSPGRLDQLLLPYFCADREAGRIDERGARELVGCFTVKLSEIIPVFCRRITRFHGGLFSGQVAVVGGVDRDGADATNDLTWIFLDAMAELRMRQPNYHARIHPASPPAYVERVAGMLRDGSAAPSVINDAVVVPMLTERGATLEDARDYSPVGCVEPVACGSTFGSTDAALLNLPLCLERALGTKPGGARAEPVTRCASIEEVVVRLAVQVDHLVHALVEDLQAIELANARYHPTPLTSALLQGCLEGGRDASAGGARYNGSGVQGVGVADVADSLAAIDEVVFRRRLCSMEALLAALRRDFAGDDDLRGYLLGSPKYGNDDPRVDGLAERVMALFSDALARHQNTRGGSYWAGFYSVTAHRAFGEATGALPSGRLAGQPLANGLSPATGLDRAGPTASLSSTAGLPLQRHARNGINVNLKIDRLSLVGPDGARAVEGLLRGYFAQGGMQVQLNVMDPATLVEARDHPERYPWLLVRVSGYSAYFNDLSPEVKQEIIDRSCHNG